MNASSIATAHARTSRVALAVLTFLSTLAFIATTAVVAERQQALADRIMQESRPVNIGENMP